MTESKTKPQQRLGVIRVCPDPQCETVHHNCPPRYTHCCNCDGWIIKINEKTYWSKFAQNYFQYDVTTGEYFRPSREEAQFELELG